MGHLSALLSTEKQYHILQMHSKKRNYLSQCDPGILRAHQSSILLPPWEHLYTCWIRPWWWHKLLKLQTSTPLLVKICNSQLFLFFQSTVLGRCFSCIIPFVLIYISLSLFVSLPCLGSRLPPLHNTCDFLSQITSPHILPSMMWFLSSL